MKSFIEIDCGRYFRWFVSPLRNPLPANPPEPIDIIACLKVYPAACGSSSGNRKIFTRFTWCGLKGRNFIIAALRASVTPGLSASYTAARTADATIAAMHAAVKSPRRQTRATKSITSVAGRSTSIVPKSGSRSMSSAGTPITAAATRKPGNFRSHGLASAAPYIHASAAITQSFATSLGWKNQSHLLPP